MQILQDDLNKKDKEIQKQIEENKHLKKLVEDLQAEHDEDEDKGVKKQENKPESLELEDDDEKEEGEDGEDLPNDPEVLKRKILEMEEYIQQMNQKIEEDEETIQQLKEQND